jgi:hypothetical protein
MAASLTELHDGMLGKPFEDTEVPVRLYRHPLDWLAAGGSTVAGLGCWPPAVCILDSGADAVEQLLFSGRPIICDDDGHAGEVDAFAVAARQRLVEQMPSLLIAERRAAA